MVDFEKIPSPCYVIDEELLRNNLTLIKEVSEKSGAEIIVAFKGFAMWGVFPIIREYINGVSASSLYEAQLAAEEMKTLAHTYSPAYTENDFHKIVHYSSHITFNSLSQYGKYLPFIKKAAKHISVGLRINPEYSAVATSLYNPCSPGTRLGITADKLKNGIPEEVEGLHFHTLCESTSYDLENTLKAVEEKFGHLFKSIKWLNMGGGHLMTKKGYDTNHLIELIRNFRKKHNLHVILEPGSAFAWETGFLISTIEDIVENNGIKTAILNVSFTAHMPDCLEMPYQPKILESSESQNTKYVYRMGGNSCLAGDYIGDWYFDHELKTGDRITFNDMIHYTMVKTTMFNGIHHPAIGMWSKEGVFKLFREFTYEDYKKRLS